MKKIIKYLGVALALLLVGWWLWNRYGMTEEKRVRRVIAKMQEVVERGGKIPLALGLEGCIAQDFGDRIGLNKTMLIEVVVGFRGQFETVNIDVSELEIQVTPAEGVALPTAEAKFTANVVGRKSGQSEQHRDKFRLTFRKNEVGWQMTSAEGEQSQKF